MVEYVQVLEIVGANGIATGKFRRVVTTDDPPSGPRGLCDHEHATPQEADDCPDASHWGDRPRCPRSDRQINVLQDERAQSFEVFQRAVGGCVLTPYQAEADIEIAARIAVVVRQRDRLRRALVGLIGASRRDELDAMEIILRAAPAPDSDKAAAIDAIDALRETEPIA